MGTKKWEGVTEKSGPTPRLVWKNKSILLLKHLYHLQKRRPGSKSKFIDKRPGIKKSQFKSKKQSCQLFSIPIILRPLRKLGKKTNIGTSYIFH